MSAPESEPGPEPGDPELEELLRKVPAEAPDPRRREEARRAPRLRL